MSVTAHNNFFGWIHSFKISRNNQIFKPNSSTERPFPIIVDDPSITQVIDNWNYADTGLVISSFVVGLFASKILSDRSHHDSLLRKRFYYKRMVNIFIATGLFLAMNNSANRLQGYVPNGLPKKRTQ